MSPAVPNLDGLIGLAHKDGVDIRPTLLRVLTDLYVQRSDHSREEQARYCELALSLLSGVDVSTRLSVAKKLAACPAAPRAVVQRLSRDVFEVAEPILMHSPCLTAQDLLYVLKEFDSRYAAAIASRVEQQRRSSRNESEDGPRQEREDHAGNRQPIAHRRSGTANSDLLPTRSEILPPAPSTRDARTEQAPPRPAGRTEKIDAFLAVSRTARRAFLSKLQAESSLWPENVTLPPIGEGLDRLEAAAFQRKTDELIRELEQALRVSPDTARKIVEDGGGEPFAIAARALSIPSSSFVRLLLFLNPTVGHSVEKVSSLAKLFEELTAETASQVVAGWREEGAGDRRLPRYQPVHWDDEKHSASRTLRSDPLRDTNLPGARSYARIAEAFKARS
jgi:hypothetical protein